MTAQNVFKEIIGFNVAITVVILIILFCLITNMEASVAKLVLSVVGLTVNLMKKKNTSKDDKIAQDNVNWLITGFVILVMYHIFNLFC